MSDMELTYVDERNVSLRINGIPTTVSYFELDKLYWECFQRHTRAVNQKVVG